MKSPKEIAREILEGTEGYVFGRDGKRVRVSVPPNEKRNPPKDPYAAMKRLRDKNTADKAEDARARRK